MNINRLDHIVITVSDVEASIRFYVDILGMELDRTNDRYAVKFSQQKINLHRSSTEFSPVAQNVTHGSGDFCLIADEDINEIYQELTNKNAPFEPGLGIVKRTGATGPINSVYLRDPDGNLVEISSYR
jgi:catechol 2,3-dioxygenase-like lactoylglutathione lyase family enzyme